MTTDAAVEAMKPVACRYCDFSSGTRGMDRCTYCKGTGSVFRVDDRTFPNTEAGYKLACEAIRLLAQDGGR